MGVNFCSLVFRFFVVVPFGRACFCLLFLFIYVVLLFFDFFFCFCFLWLLFVRFFFVFAFILFGKTIRDSLGLSG